VRPRRRRGKPDPLVLGMALFVLSVAAFLLVLLWTSPARP
jgi:hypothetical protein